MDHRLFQPLAFPGAEVRAFDWDTASRPSNLREIAIGMLASAPEPPDIVIGCSMGGMVALELSHLVPLSLVIQISSSTGPNDWKPWMKWVRSSRAYELTAPQLIELLLQLAPSMLAIRDEKIRSLVMSMIRETGGEFLRTSVRCIMKWNGLAPATKLIRIIGTRDQLFDYRHMPGALLIEKAGHDAILSHSTEINALILSTLEQHFGPPHV